MWKNFTGYPKTISLLHMLFWALIERPPYFEITIPTEYDSNIGTKILKDYEILKTLSQKWTQILA